MTISTGLIMARLLGTPWYPGLIRTALDLFLLDGPSRFLPALAPLLLGDPPVYFPLKVCNLASERLFFFSKKVASFASAPLMPLFSRWRSAFLLARDVYDPRALFLFIWIFILPSGGPSVFTSFSPFI